jgi:hypothetical protein
MRTWEHDQGASVLSSSSKQHKGREKGEGSDVFSGLSVVALGIALQEDLGGRDCDHPHTGYYRNKLFFFFLVFPPSLLIAIRLKN